MPNRNAPVRIVLDEPPELGPGVYANALGVSSSVHEFTLHFASSLPVQQETDESGDVVALIQPHRVVGRFKVPPTLVVEMLRVISFGLDDYEARFGEIRRSA